MEQAETRLAAAQALLRKKGDEITFIGGSDKFELLSASVAETLVFPHNWTQLEICTRVRRAIIETVRSVSPKWADFVKELCKACDDIKTAKLEEYAMWTMVNATPAGDFKAISFRSDDIFLKLPSLPAKKLRFIAVESPSSGPVRWDYPDRGLIITARGRFRSENQAGEGLFQAISDICALLNLAEHRHLRTYRSGEARPKATLLTGKYHFLFRGGASTHANGLWYNSDFRENFWKQSSFSTKNIIKSSDYAKQFLKDMKKSPSALRIRASIRLQYEGWQCHDQNERILWTWTAFETLLSRSTDRIDDYDTIKKRALFIAKQPKLEEIAFDLAIKYRNRFVHENGQCGAAESVAEYLDSYLITMAEWMIQRFVRFESHARFLDMLDTPRDPKKSREQIIDRRRALRSSGR